MSDPKEFKFLIKMPRLLPAENAKEQIFHVYAEYPHYMYAVKLKTKEEFAEVDQFKLAVAELKVRLIQDISNAKFEMDENP